MSELPTILRGFGSSDEGLESLMWEAAKEIEQFEIEAQRLRNDLVNLIRAVDWCIENDPDRMSDVVFDAAVQARSALEEKE